MNQIDFVITWVDGNNPIWLKEFDKYSPNLGQVDVDKRRYRSWDNLQYWFRGVEKFAPWVNKIHFVTCGHIPEWLNTEHPKLNIVRHEDYIPKENLPVFNSHPIEINLHRIKGLAEKFVYFNDDFFITNNIKPSRFFKKNLPRDIAVSNVLDLSGIEHILANNLSLINKHFSKHEILKTNFFKWFNLKYKRHNLKTIFLLPWKQVTGFFDPHQAQPFLKSTFNEVWNLEKDILNITSRSKFRSQFDVSQYLFRYWQLMSGKFEPVDISDSKLLVLHNLQDCAEFSSILTQYNLIFLNDEIDDDNDFNKYKNIINQSFSKILPDKSSFEL
jgi:hypothetical protein